MLKHIQELLQAQDAGPFHSVLAKVIDTIKLMTDFVVTLPYPSQYSPTGDSDRTWRRHIVHIASVRHISRDTSHGEPAEN